MNWLTAGWEAARDEVRFRLHDRRTRRERVAATVDEFPTADVERELAEVRSRMASELQRRFNGPMRANRDRLAAASSLHAALGEELAVLERDHNAELDDAYARKAGLRSEMDAAKASVDDARGDLRRVRSRISSWHARSRSHLPFYGKRGKPIPRHSWFVFSHSDLDSAKRDADRAGSRIAAAVRERDRVWSRLQRVGEEIEGIKASRTRRKAMLDSGRTRTKVQAEARAIMSEIVRLEGAEGRMAGLRERFLAGGPEALGIAMLEERIRGQLARRVAAMEAFDGPLERARRRAAFAASPDIGG